MTDVTAQRVQQLLGGLVNQASNEPIALTANLFAENILDSFSIIEYIAGLEKEFAIKISNAELLPDNFRDIDSTVQMVERLIKAG